MNTKSEQSHSEWLKNVKHVFVSFIAKRIAMERYTVHCWLCAHCTNLHWISYTSCVLIRYTVHCWLCAHCTNLHWISCTSCVLIRYTADCVHTAQIFTEQAALLVFWYATLLTVCTLHKSSLNKLHFLCSDTVNANSPVNATKEPCMICTFFCQFLPLLYPQSLYLESDCMPTCGHRERARMLIR